MYTSDLANSFLALSVIEENIRGVALNTDTSHRSLFSQICEIG